MNCFSWIKVISVLVHFKYCQYNIPSLQLTLAIPVKFHPGQVKPLFNAILIMVFIGFFVLPHSTTRHDSWMYQTICQVKSVKFIINQYLNVLSTYQKAESPRAASLSKLDNTVNKNYIFKTIKCAKFSTNWWVPFDFHNNATTLTISTKIFLQLILASLFRP